MLWDVDHTLVSIKGLTREIYGGVLLSLTGVELATMAVMGGRTERAIITDVLRVHGLEVDAELVEAVAEAVSREYVVRSAEIAGRGFVREGAREVLGVLAGRGDVVQSLLTGNTEAIARTKLGAFGLAEFVDFSVGAYGMDDLDRPPLVKLARERAAAKYGEMFDEESTVLIGDTLDDVRAGREGGARVVGVATGTSTVDELKRAGADHVLADLSDTATTVRAVLDLSGP
ncbi:phosphoglycolate phosphatase-like HAD superfamily hydrolase [Actinocorallia herbida]|uniref:Phosphoglycolate phosphatase-like HAD superfamily hydrolase n=1 Tax=Actinocorallia herbida TaxID=58109 RepID=A0A3N1D1N0_9ACTN|nr:phosphoglycolate phosphatase-like HAD superfamily hydrolase [Actinocorallia herbida]